MTGGELTLETLDLIYDETSKFYEAPFQMKANGGIFMVDDFGRQRVSPKDLLNRWIVPLEKRVDYLTLHTGKKIEIPFDMLIIFSTNLDPADLVEVRREDDEDRKSTRLNSSHSQISYAVFCLKKKNNTITPSITSYS